jgi:hypothetical protein
VAGRPTGAQPAAGVTAACQGAAGRGDPEGMNTASPLPLVLALHPLLPLRAPEVGCSTLTYGYQLRLPDGPALADDDVLLGAFAGWMAGLPANGDHDEPLQHEAFAPGRRLRLLPEGVDDDGDPVVGVWDADRVRRAGYLAYRRAALVVAALEQGLVMEALVLTEERALLDDRRVGLQLLVHPAATLRVELGDAAGPDAPRRPVRDRVVLLADGSGELRWWDPSGRAGPMDLGELPVSVELAAELERLSSEFVKAAGGADTTAADPLDAFERDWASSALESRAVELWRRARAELGQRYAIGLQGPGMTRPAWSPGDMSDDEEEE